MTVPEEGGRYSMRKDIAAPIRIYSDRWIEDDIVKKLLGRKKRNRLSKNEYRKIRSLATQGDALMAGATDGY